LQEAKDMAQKQIITKDYATADENSNWRRIFDLFKECPIPDDELLSNIGLFIKRQDLSHILF